MTREREPRLSFMPGLIAPEKQTVIQLFRARVNDSNADLFQQEGLFIP